MTGPAVDLGETFSFRDDFSIVRGAHAFKLGYELLRFRLDSTTQNRASGLFSFSDMTAGLQQFVWRPYSSRCSREEGYLTSTVLTANPSRITHWLRKFQAISVALITPPITPVP